MNTRLVRYIISGCLLVNMCLTACGIDENKRLVLNRELWEQLRVCHKESAARATFTRDDQALAKDPLLKSFFDKGLVHFYARNSLISDAEVILLGEEHGDVMIQENIAFVVNTLYQKGDVLLDEGLDYLEPFPFYYRNQMVDTRYITSAIPIYGWDNMQLNSENADLLRIQKPRLREQILEAVASKDVELQNKYLEKLVKVSRDCIRIEDLRSENILPAISHFLNKKSKHKAKRVFLRAGLIHLELERLHKIGEKFKYVFLNFSKNAPAL